MLNFDLDSNLVRSQADQEVLAVAAAAVAVVAAAVGVAS